METFRFGTFEVNVRTGELRKRGVRIALQDQPLKILSALLERPGDVIATGRALSQAVAERHVRRFRAQSQRSRSPAADGPW